MGIVGSSVFGRWISQDQNQNISNLNILSFNPSFVRPPAHLKCDVKSLECSFKNVFPLPLFMGF